MGCSNSVSAPAKSSKGTLLAVRTDSFPKATHDQEHNEDQHATTATPPLAPERVETTTSVDDVKAGESALANVEVFPAEVNTDVEEPGEEPEPAVGAHTAHVGAELEALALRIQAVQRGRAARQQVGRLHDEGGMSEVKSAEAGVAETDIKLEATVLKIQSLQRGMAARQQVRGLSAEGNKSETKSAEADATAAAEEPKSANDAEPAACVLLQSGMVLDCDAVSGPNGEELGEELEPTVGAEIADVGAEMEAAALKIQALQRGNAGRQQVERLKPEGGTSEMKTAKTGVTEADAELDATVLKIQSLQRGMTARQEIKMLSAEGETCETNIAEADVTATADQLKSSNDAVPAACADLQSRTVSTLEAAPEKRGLIFNMEGLGIYDRFVRKSATAAF